MRRRVLVIEDDEDGRETLRLLLEVQGHEVEVAENGRGGAAKALSSRPEVVLVDIGLPDIDGYTVARQIRTGAHGADMLIVALTGYGASTDRQQAIEAGFDAHLVKPVEPGALARLLAGEPPAGAPRAAR
jgi:CheY-like chemotaxis protein